MNRRTISPLTRGLAARRRAFAISRGVAWAVDGAVFLTLGIVAFVALDQFSACASRALASDVTGGSVRSATVEGVHTSRPSEAGRPSWE